MTQRIAGRRAFLGATGLAGATALAGCLLGEGDDGDDPGDGSEDESQTLDPDAVAPYRQFQYDAANAGAVPERSLGDDPAERWRFQRGASGPGYHVGSPAVAHGTVYVAETSDDDADEPTLYALEPTDGSVSWSRTVAPAGGAPPVAATDDLVLVQGAAVRALDRDGEDVWRTSEEYEFSRVLAVGDDRAFGVSTTLSATTLVAVSLSDGTAAWDAELAAARVPPQVGVGPDAVYVGGSDLQAFGRDGRERWTAGLEHSVAVAPTVADDRIFVAGSDDGVSAVSPGGDSLWETTVEGSSRARGSGPIDSSPAYDGERLYVSNTGRITALDPADGTELWATDTGFADAPVVGADGVLAAGLNELHCLDPATGERRWTFHTDADSGSRISPALLDGAVLYPSDGLHAVGT